MRLSWSLRSINWDYNIIQVPRIGPPLILLPKETFAQYWKAPGPYWNTLVSQFPGGPTPLNVSVSL